MMSCGAATTFSAAVWQHSETQRLPVVNVLVFTLCQGCQLWRMHSRWGMLMCSPSICDQTPLRHIVGVKYATPRALLMEEVGVVTSVGVLLQHSNWQHTDSSGMF